MDHLGSTRLKTNSTGGIIYESNYEPYGPGCGETGSEDYRYTGKRENPTGLYYFGARYYDLVTGRFTTRDTFPGYRKNPQSQNPYAYCLNNPNKFVDPTGHFGFSPIPPGGITGILEAVSFLGYLVGLVVESTAEYIGGAIAGILNPNPEPDTSISTDGIVESNLETASIENLNDYLSNSGIVLSGDEEQYDDFVEGLDPIDDTPKHKKNAESKNLPFEEYQDSAVKDELSFRLNNLDDPSINLYYDTSTGNWNIEQNGDLIGFNAYKVTTWFQSGYDFTRDRWIPFPFLPLP